MGVPVEGGEWAIVGGTGRFAMATGVIKKRVHERTGEGNIIELTIQALLEAAALPSVFTLGKEPFALGKGFAECSTRQSPLGKIFLVKGSLPSVFYRGTRQNKKQFCRVLGTALGKIFSAVARRPLTVILPSARPSTRQNKILFF